VLEPYPFPSFFWFQLVGGVLGSRWGLKLTLLIGLACQMVSLVLLAAMDYSWPRTWLVAYITGTQALSGIAKDLVKMSGKSVTKITASEQALLLKLVAFLTGAKNTMKGVGYFLGSLLLNYLGTLLSLVVLFCMIISIIPFGIFMLGNHLGKSSTTITLEQVFNKGRNVNVLSAARFFLFGARDVWFEIALPIFLRGVLGWSYTFVGGFMACWIIFYGCIQSTTPQLVLAPLSCSPPIPGHITSWTFMLAFVTGGIALSMHFVFSNDDYNTTVVVVVTGLMIFAFVFAVNSSIHSYLILAYTNKDKVAMNVGFYYMANAGGRLAGTLLSGILYQVYNIETCLWASMAFLLASGMTCFFLGKVPSNAAIDKWGD